MPQEDKIFLNLAGEFAVASELNRRRVLASVTCGASKSADIFAVNRNMTRIVRIEVKATQKGKWPIGEKATKLTPGSDDVIWVLVLFPEPLVGSTTDDAQRGAHAPRFFVLTAQEIYLAYKGPADRFNAGYQIRHGKPFDEGRGVPNVRLQDVENFEGKWEKVVSRLERSAS